VDVVTIEGPCELGTGPLTDGFEKAQYYLDNKGTPVRIERNSAILTTG